MTTPEFRTLAYEKSPKTSKRTTFQDELQAAVSARASKTSTNSYPDDFEEDEDDFLNKLIKSRKKKTDAFKASKNKPQFNTFELSDEEGRDNPKKKVSFLKTQRNISLQNNTITESESHDDEVLDSSVTSSNNLNDTFTLKHTKNGSDEVTQSENGFLDNTGVPNTELSSGESMSHQELNSSPSDLTSSQTLESRTAETPVMDSTVLLTASHVSPIDSVEKQPPRPKPRQRTFGLGCQTVQKPVEESEAVDVSRPNTSCTSNHLSSDASSNVAVTSFSPHCLEEDNTESHSLSKSSSKKSERSQLGAKSTGDSGSKDEFVSDDSKEQERNISASHNEGNECPTPVSPVPETLLDSTIQSSLCKTAHRSQSECSFKVESKYLGTLKILDQKVSSQESELLSADSLRASVYQDWLRKKKKIIQIKQKEKFQKEDQKKEQEIKGKETGAAYKAWKEKKGNYLKAKAEAQEDRLRKEQQAAQEREERKQTAIQVFEKWKNERDHLLMEKSKKQHEMEKKLKMKKQEQDEERKNNCKAAFSNWCAKKKHVLHEKHRTQQKTLQSKMEEERYMKEERDQLALDMYESWLARKDLEQKRQRKERIVEAILSSSSPPPPWSPPNKTVPFKK